MTPYEVLLSESQERMLIVVRARRVAEVRAVFDRYELHAAEIGARHRRAARSAAAPAGELVCEVPGRALADDAPRYAIAGAPAAAARGGPRDARRRATDRRPPCSSCSARRTLATASRSGAATTT